MLKKYLVFFICLICFILSSCDNKQTIDNLPIVVPNIPINTESIELSSDFQPVIGEIIYLPIYSNIYHSNQKRLHNLGITITVHNTDLENNIIIKSFKYYDTQGNLIENYIQNPVSLKPLASTNLFIADNDTRGGIGSNFLIEWVADQKVSSPKAEAIMLSTASTQGISFTSQGKVIRELKPNNQQNKIEWIIK